MLYSEKYKKRAVELFERCTAAEVFDSLKEEFPGIFHPDRKTLWRWKITQTEEESKQTTEIKAEEATLTAINPQLKEHYDELAEVAITIMGPLAGLKPMWNLPAKDGDIEVFEIDRADNLGDNVIDSVIIRSEHIPDALSGGIEKAYDMHRDFNLFDCFLSHLSKEDVALADLDKSKLQQYAKASPMELIDLLKGLALIKDFKGKCEICKDL